MKWSFASVALIVLGLTGVAVIMLFQQITTNNENDYYLLKEVTEAAMIDAIDIPYYRETGNLKIVTEKFIENFTRRFAESTIFVSSTYKINFYDIMEMPPKVSIIIDTGLGQYTIHGNSDEYNIANRLDAILEYTGENTYSTTYPYTTDTLVNEYYAMPSVNGGNFNSYYSLKIPSDLTDPNYRNITITSVKFINERINTQGELNEALLKEELSFNNVTTDYMQSINDFATNVSGVDISFYDCESRTGNYKNTYKCDDNNYWVSVNGSTSDLNRDKVILKYQVTWSYERYDY